MDISFIEDFQALTGTTHTPFLWQRRLYEQFIANELPRRLDIPTGLGKTSVLPIWLLARQQNPKLPRRLIYVVNRRTIVDQATDLAEKMQSNWADLNSTLYISTLRGAREDNGDWKRDPAAQAIIIGTVDLIGSRLLFNAYRGSRWHKSFEAGLIGQDALIVHDEAHLTLPFDRLLDRVVELQQREPAERRLKVLSLSATKSPSEKSITENVFILQKEDLAEEEVKKRVNATKQLRFEELQPKQKLAERMAELACEYKDSAVRVLVFVRSPEDALKVVSGIKKLIGKSADQDRVETLTGTIRGYERDQLVEKAVFKHFVEPTALVGGAVYLICTSAGEIGVDFDADHLVCDLSMLDSMIQRLGRVNRRGSKTDTRVHVVVDFKAKETEIDLRRKLTRQLIESLPQNDQGHDVSPQSLRSLIPHSQYEDAITPPVQTLTLQPMTLDAWSLTSITEDWPLAADVEPYLHGILDEENRTEVAWRKEFDWMEGVAEEDVGLDRLFEEYRLMPREILSDRTDRICNLLIRIKEARAGRGLKAGRVVIMGKKPNFLDLASEDERSLYRKILNRMVVIPAGYGGIDLETGMIDEGMAGVEEADIDVADVNYEEAQVERFRVLLERGDDEWHPAFALPEGFTSPGEESSQWKQWVKTFVGPNRCRCVHEIEMYSPANGDEEISKVILFFEILPEYIKTKDIQLELAQHNQDVAKVVHRICDALALDQAIAAPAELAGASHDLGKGCDLWQRSIYNPNRHPDYAKSSKRGMKWQILGGYRHEFGSLIQAIRLADFENLSGDEKEMCLHLIAVHHGRGRPHFPAGARDPGSVETLSNLLSPATIANRFCRLQRKYGHWGLAWLEAILICADREASAKADGRQA